MQKTNIPQAESKSADLIAQNLEQLKQIFPEVIKEGKVDFEALNDLLGNYGDTAEERFALNWAGKANARREAQKRSTGTLRPCPEESVDWDSTENLYIEGDNLEVLKLMQKSYHSRVKMIYIDPPYNTGKDFVYKDNYTDNMKNYLELTGQDKKLSTNTESDGRYHSNWLNMMYPRLKLARNLLAEDGVIFISIDDNEVANLRKICDEIFGEENFVGEFIWRKKNGGGQAKEYFVIEHEYILVYKSTDAFVWFDTIEDRDLVEFKKTDEQGKYKITKLAKWGNTARREDRPSMYFSLRAPDGCEVFPVAPDGNDGRWRVGKERMDYLKEKNLVHWENRNGDWIAYEKEYFDNQRKTVKDRSMLYSIANTGDGTNVLTELFDRKDTFENPKPIEIISLFVDRTTRDNDIILDFFSGSATTAHAVMQLNAEDGGNRKYICVQIPEPTPEESEARKAGYATIPEIAKERIRRAGKKIMEEQKAKAEKEGGLFAEEEKKLDIGFKVFKLDSSNINAWDSDPDNLETALNNSLFNIKEDRSEDDLLYEILIKYGIELTEKINRHTIDGKTVYEMGAGSLIVCLADSLSTAVAEGIGKLYKEVSPEGVDANCRVVFKEAGFNGSDEVKTNTLLILKQHGIINVATV